MLLLGKIKNKDPGDLPSMLPYRHPQRQCDSIGQVADVKGYENSTCSVCQTINLGRLGILRRRFTGMEQSTISRSSCTLSSRSDENSRHFCIVWALSTTTLSPVRHLWLCNVACSVSTTVSLQLVHYNNNNNNNYNNNKATYECRPWTPPSSWADGVRRSNLSSPLYVISLYNNTAQDIG